MVIPKATGYEPWNASSLPHAKLMRAIELLGTRVAPVREHGRVLTGDIFVVPNDSVDDVVARVADAANAARDIDWRLHDIVVMPVSRLSNAIPPKAEL